MSDQASTRAATEALAGLVQAGFKQPRKTLANSLSEGLGCSKQAAADLLIRAAIDPSLRPQALAVVDWVGLYRCV